MDSGPPARDNRYIVDSVARACALLRAFEQESEELRLRDLGERTGLNTTTAFRLLYTLEQCGLVAKTHNGEYRLLIKQLKRAKYRFAYASQAEDSTFSQEWSESIIQAVSDQGIEILVFNNGFDPEAALANVDRMIQASVDIAIVHQFNEQIAPIIANKFLEAKIPLIAMGTAHPGAVYYGGNNYQAGLIGGRYLGQWARQHWRGAAQELMLLELSMAGPLLQSRLRGVEAGLKETLPDFDNARMVRLGGSGQFGDTIDVVRKHLRQTRARRILVGAVNDPCALGALRALEEAGWEEDCAVMGQGGSYEGRQELRRAHSHLIGTVAFYPERYGEGILRLALALLAKKSVPPAVFVKHQLLTPANVDHHYPNDLIRLSSS